MPEVLYYGGRVYSDLGVYPVALEHFEEALEMLNANGGYDKDQNKLALASHVVSQTGRLYNEMRVYPEAEKYIKEAVRVDKTLKDSINLMYDYELLGIIQFHQDAYQRAKESFEESNKISSIKRLEVKYVNDGYLSYIALAEGDTLKALKRIRGAIEKAPDYAMPTIYGYATEIYLKASELDTAAAYCKAIISLPNSYNKEQGYQRLLSRQLLSHIPPDSIPIYFEDYKKLLDNYYNDNENHAFMVQHSLFNYNLHDREKREAEDKLIEFRNKAYRIGMMLIMLLIVAIAVILWNRYRRQKAKAEHLEALNRIKFMEDKLAFLKANEDLIPSHEDKVHIPNPTHQIEMSLEERIKKILMQLEEREPQLQNLNPLLLESDAYKELIIHIKKKDVLHEEHEFWDKLEESVTEAYPDFIKTYHYLMMGNGKSMDLHIVLLLKCRVALKYIPDLIGRSKATVSLRRKNLSSLMFNQDLSLDKFDLLIALL